MAVEEDLQLDITAALNAVQQLEQQISAAITRAANESAETLSSILGQPVTVPIEAGAEQAAQQVDDALSGLRSTVDIDANVDDVEGSIDAAVDAADTEVEVTADASDVTAEIDSAVDAADTTAVVEVDADTSQAEEGISELGSTARESAADLGGLSGATEQFAGFAGLAAGSSASLTQALPKSPAVAGAAGALTALGVATGVMFREALQADTAQRRYNRSLGEFADEVEDVDVGGLNEQISSLALRLGSSDDAIRLAAARIFDLGTSSGTAAPKVARTTEQIVALAARAVAVNPTLGDVGDVTERITGALARGGRFLGQYGIALTATEIKARALADTGKSAADELTQYDLAAAGAALATERFGDSLGRAIDEGAQGAELRLRSIRQRFSEFLEGLGAELIDPVLDFAEAIEQPAEDLAEIFARLAAALLPAVTSLLNGLIPALDGGAAVAEVLLAVLSPIVGLLDAIPGPAIAAAGAFLAIQKGVQLLANTMAATGAIWSAGTVAGLAPALGIIGAAIVAVTAIISAHNRSKQEAKKRDEEWADAIAADTKALRENNAELSTNVQQLLAKKLGEEDVVDALVKAGVRAQTVAEAFRSGDAAVRRLTLSLFAQGTAGGEAALVIGDLFEQYKKAHGAQDLLRIFTESATGAISDETDAMSEQQRTLQDLIRSQERAGRNTEGLSALFRVLFDDVRTGTASFTELAGAATALGVPEEDIARFVEIVQSATDRLVESFTSKIPSAADAMSTSVDAAISLLAENTKKHGEEIGLSADDLGKALDGVKGKFSLKDVIAELDKQAGQIKAFYDNVKRLTDAGMSSTVEIILEKGPIAGAQLAQALVDADAKQRTAFETSVNNYQSQVGRAQDIVVDSTRRLPGLTDRLARDVTAAFDKALDLAGVSGRDAESARAALTDVLNGEAGTRIGEDFVRGIELGMDHVLPSLRDTVRQIGDEVIVVVSNQMQIRSPSRIAMDIGEQFMEGLRIGFERRGAAVIAEGAGVAAETVDEVRAAFASVPSVAVAPSVLRAARPTATQPTARFGLDMTQARVVEDGGMTFIFPIERAIVPEDITDIAPRKMRAAVYRSGRG